MKRNKRNGLEQVVKKIVQASASGIAVAPAGIAVVSIAAESVTVIRAGIAASRRNAFFQLQAQLARLAAAAYLDLGRVAYRKGFQRLVDFVGGIYLRTIDRNNPVAALEPELTLRT